jgi:plastocyanin
MMRRLLVSIAVLTVAAFAFAGFSYSPASRHTSAKALTAKVNIVNSGQSWVFKPATIKVKKGTSITWTNKSSIAHTVTNMGGSMHYNKNINAGKKLTIKFTKVGTFKYHCIFHSTMKGQVTVHS